MKRANWIRASEINAYGYCARSWWLQYVVGLEPEDRGQFTAGQEQHRAHGRQVLRTVAMQRVALVILALGLFLAAVALFLFLRGG